MENFENPTKFLVLVPKDVGCSSNSWILDSGCSFHINGLLHEDDRGIGPPWSSLKRIGRLRQLV